MTAVAVLATGCATMTGARPLEPGRTAAGLTLGGGLVKLGGPVPLPNTVLEVRHGLPHLAQRPFEIGYGLNATALAFGVIQGHVGASWLLIDQSGAAPALAVTNRVFAATNLLGLPTRYDAVPQAWAADQLELTASWLAGQQLPYVSLSQYLDFGSPQLALTPAVGVVWDFREPDRGLTLQTEARWYAVNQTLFYDIVDRYPAHQGALGITVGLGMTFGGAR
jgi:hypothetical protein